MEAVETHFDFMLLVFLFLRHRLILALNFLFGWGWPWTWSSGYHPIGSGLEGYATTSGDQTWATCLLSKHSSYTDARIASCLASCKQLSQSWTCRSRKSPCVQGACLYLLKTERDDLWQYGFTEQDSAVLMVFCTVWMAYTLFLTLLIMHLRKYGKMSKIDSISKHWALLHA